MLEKSLYGRHAQKIMKWKPSCIFFDFTFAYPFVRSTHLSVVGTSLHVRIRILTYTIYPTPIYILLNANY
jgi:hypothetical protein